MVAIDLIIIIKSMMVAYVILRVSTQTLRAA